ncbi:MAG: NUDIX domain-containing protein [Candidatus Roizmanbacteria bacterium]|nr:NUDIX domain-containing protein [Candidatus Roizmanbacteria bacterium]
MSEQPVGSCVLVLNPKKTHILLGKRLNSYKAGYYGIPGGRVELGEPLEVCAQRELYEETQLTGSTFKFLGTIRENQESYDFIHFVFACTTFTGEVTLAEPDKCESWKWFSLDNLPRPILPGHKLAINLYENFLAGKNSYLVDVPKK